MYRVCTYPDPFNINSNSELWSLMTNSPHFCASQTLVQGLHTHYQKSSFYFMQPLQTLIDNVFFEWNNNFDNDIKLFLAVSDYIKNIENETLKNAFKFNISEIVEGVRLLLVMRASSDMFDCENLTFEQKEILKIYNHILGTDIGKVFDKYDNLTKDNLKDILNKCLLDDINNYLQREKNSIQINCKDLSSAKEKLISLNEEYKEKVAKPNIVFGIGSNNNYAEKINVISRYIELIENGINFDKVVIHGVHKITPLMYFLFNLLNNLDIEVIFVINYMKNYKSVCDTWNKVYSFTKCKFEYVSDLLDIYNDVGRQLGGVFENNYSERELTNKLFKYKNLTHFTDDVSSVYAEAKKTNKEHALGNMKTQYYSIDCNNSNKILKIYYPEQFGSKHFLSYPIGQFILNIYNMWDSKNKCLNISFDKLYECINSGLLIKGSPSTLLNICKKLKLFFPEEMTEDVFNDKIIQLKKNISLINNDNNLQMLKRISFYNVDDNSIDILKEYIDKLVNIAKILFADDSVNYRQHFNKLMEIISSSIDNDNISKIELDLIKEISGRLNSTTSDNIVGSVEDIKEAIFYYLSFVKELDTSNWIVRGFDQIDGGVLLSIKSNSEKYHFSSLSNNHLCGKQLKQLPYPLTLDMFKNYEESDSCVNVMYECFKEERNYLRFYLFYALMFTRKKIELSYIENESDEEETLPYYPLIAMGLKVEEKGDSTLNRLQMDREDDNALLIFDINPINNNAKEIFSICPYKYFLTTVLKDDISYFNDYHVKHYSIIFLITYLTNKYKDCKYSQVEEDIDNDLKNFKQLFSFMIDIEYLDVIRKVKEDIQIQIEDDIIKPFSNQHINRKINFLIAQWRIRSFDGEESESQMIYPEDRIDSVNEEIIDYMNNNSTHNFEIRKKFPYMKVCENCNYNEVCLRQYYEVLENEYNDIVDSGESE